MERPVLALHQNNNYNNDICMTAGSMQVLSASRALLKYFAGITTFIYTAPREGGIGASLLPQIRKLERSGQSTFPRTKAAANGKSQSISFFP